MDHDGGGLVLSLKPKERFLVGGALLENGPKRSTVRVLDDGVFVLRLSDAIHPDQVATPVTRAYHAVQMILACEISVKEGHAPLAEQLAELLPIFSRTEGQRAITIAVEAADAGRYYSVLRALAALVPIEASLLGIAPSSGDLVAA